MAGKTFELTEATLSVIEEIGGHMPGGLFIYKRRIFPKNGEKQ